MGIILFIFVLALVFVAFIAVLQRKHQQRTNYIKKEAVASKERIDAFEASCTRFKKWKQSTSSTEWIKMLKTVLARFDHYGYVKDEDIQDYDIQYRMMMLCRNLNDSQLKEIYPEPNELKAYISGGHFSSKRKKMYEYFRHIFEKNDLYEWKTVREIMFDPLALSSHQQGVTRKAIEYHMQKLSEEFNGNSINEEFYEKGIKDLLDSYFPCITIDSDAQLRAKEDYLSKIRTAHKNNEISDKEFSIQEKWMQLSINLHDE